MPTAYSTVLLDDIEPFPLSNPPEREVMYEVVKRLAYELDKRKYQAKDYPFMHVSLTFEFTVHCRGEIQRGHEAHARICNVAVASESGHRCAAYKLFDNALEEAAATSPNCHVPWEFKCARIALIFVKSVEGCGKRCERLSRLCTPPPLR